MRRVKHRRVSPILLACYPLLGNCSLGNAQAHRGETVGFVVDPAQAAVSGARITARSLEAGYARESIAGPDEGFRFTLLDTRVYRIDVTAQGFETMVREPITVRTAEVTDLRRLSLTIGTASETVTVKGDAALLQFGAETVSNSSKEYMFTYADTMSRVAGRHALRLGATFTRHQLNTNQDPYAAGQVCFYQFTDLLLGQNGTGGSNLLAEFASTGSFEKDLRFDDLTAFFQDDWRVLPNLTVNLGPRWD
jgi:outer membrane receptor protein involved in Fe transport